MGKATTTEEEDLTPESTREILRSLAGETLDDTAVMWADLYVKIHDRMNASPRASTLGQDTTKEIAALILVQLMEKHA